MDLFNVTTVRWLTNRVSVIPKLKEKSSSYIICVVLFAGLYGCALQDPKDSFQFSRFQTTAKAKDDIFSFFYATNRDPGQNSNIYKTESPILGAQLTFGSFETYIANQVHVGPGSTPSKWFNNEEVRVIDIHEFSNPEFIQKLKQSVASSQYKSVLVVVWGYKERFETAAMKTAYFSNVLDLNTPVVLFDWPGNQGKYVAGYKKSRRIATASGEHLASLLKLIIEQIHPEKLWVTASSLGAQVVCDAFSWMYRDVNFADSENEISHVLLSAPDVGDEEFNVHFKNELSVLAEHLTAYVSSNDQVLLISSMINWSKRLGLVERNQPDQLDEALDLMSLVASGANISVVDVTAINKTRNKHHYYTDSPEFFDDFYQRLLLAPPIQSRHLYPTLSNDGAIYWIMKEK